MTFESLTDEVRNELHTLVPSPAEQAAAYTSVVRRASRQRGMGRAVVIVVMPAMILGLGLLAMSGLDRTKDSPMVGTQESAASVTTPDVTKPALVTIPETDPTRQSPELSSVVAACKDALGSSMTLVNAEETKNARGLADSFSLSLLDTASGQRSIVSIGAAPSDTPINMLLPGMQGDLQALPDGYSGAFSRSGSTTSVVVLSEMSPSFYVFVRADQPSGAPNIEELATSAVAIAATRPIR